MRAALTLEQARRVYDRLGGRIDLTEFYEGRVVHQLVRESRFDEARSVLEFGCGTGRVAGLLFDRHLSPDCQYTGVDISPRMVELASRRLARWSDRARVIETTGDALDFEPGSFDRFLSTFVFDLLEPNYIHDVVAQAYRLLEPGGLICLTSLAPGATPLARIVTGLWQQVWAVNPILVGGCRPVDVSSALPADAWELEYSDDTTLLRLTSAIIVARRLPEVSHRSDLSP